MTQNEARIKFYKDYEEVSSVEFISGKVVRKDAHDYGHLRASSNLLGHLLPFVESKRIGEVFGNSAMLTLTNNDYEPDIVYFKTEKSKEFTSGQFLFPAPGFIVEILSPSTEKNDRGIKFNDYAAHGVEEYWIIDADEKVVEQYFLKEDIFVIHQKYSEESTIMSKAVEGWSINWSAIFA